MVINLSERHSLVGHWLSEIRDVQIQADRMRFRRNLERIGEVAAYEISREMTYRSLEITTSLGISKSFVLEEQPVLATILRAGLPLHQGLLNYFDQADHAFVTAYRHHATSDSFDIQMDYLSCPPLEGRFLILADTMLATGASLVKTIHRLLEYGQPSAIHVVTAIASRTGIEKVQKLAGKLKIWAAAIDEELNGQGYIVPGLGDAGDLAYGEKKQQ